MTDNALAVYEQFDTMQRVAIVLHESGYFSDVKSKDQAIIKVMAGAELGLPPFASMTGIHIIEGKPALGANVIATLVKNDPRYDYRVREMTDTVCRIEFFEGGVSCGTSEFTAQDARKAATKHMDKFPKNMLFARAMSNGAKWFTPGIFGGAAVYTPDELGADVDEDGNIVEGEIVPPRQAPVNRQPAPLAPLSNPIPPGLNPETGEVLPVPPPEASWEDLGNVESPVTIDPAKWELFRGKVADNKRSTVGSVCSAATMTGAYRSDAHALNAALKISADLDRGTTLPKEDALRLFDRLIDRKRQPQQATLLEPADVSGYGE